MSMAASLGKETGGRSVAPDDGRDLGPLIRNLRRTMPETAFVGMPIVAGADLRAFLTEARLPRAFGRGGTACNRKQGDPITCGPNPLQDA